MDCLARYSIRPTVVRSIACQMGSNILNEVIKKRRNHREFFCLQFKRFSVKYTNLSIFQKMSLWENSQFRPQASVINIFLPHACLPVLPCNWPDLKFGSSWNYGGKSQVINIVQVNISYKTQSIATFYSLANDDKSHEPPCMHRRCPCGVPSLARCTTNCLPRVSDSKKIVKLPYLIDWPASCK